MFTSFILLAFCVFALAGCGGSGGKGGGGGNAPGEGSGGGDDPVTTTPTVTVPTALVAGIVVTIDDTVLLRIANSGTAGTAYYDNTDSGTGEFAKSVSSGSVSWTWTANLDGVAAKLTLEGTGSDEGNVFSGRFTEEIFLVGFEKEGGKYKRATATIKGRTHRIQFNGTPLPDGSSTTTTPEEPISTTQVSESYFGEYNLAFGLAQGNNPPYQNGEIKHIEIKRPGTLIIGSKAITNATNHPTGGYATWTDGDLSFVALTAPGVGLFNLSVFRNGQIVGIFQDVATFLPAGQPEDRKLTNGKLYAVIVTENTVEGKEGYGFKAITVGQSGVVTISGGDGGNYSINLETPMFGTSGGRVSLTGGAVQDSGWDVLGSEEIEGVLLTRESRIIVYFDVTKQEVTKIEHHTRFLKQDGSLDEEYHLSFQVIGVVQKPYY